MNTTADNSFQLSFIMLFFIPVLLSHSKPDLSAIKCLQNNKAIAFKLFYILAKEIVWYLLVYRTKKLSDHGESLGQRGGFLFIFWKINQQAAILWRYKNPSQQCMYQYYMKSLLLSLQKKKCSKYYCFGNHFGW